MSLSDLGVWFLLCIGLIVIVAALEAARREPW